MGEKKRAILRGVPDGHTSYSLLWLQVSRALGLRGYDVNTLPIPCSPESKPIPRWASDSLVRKVQVEPWELVIHCPSFGPTEKKDIVYFTMWEATRLPRQAVLNLNNTVGVMVPSEWQQCVFSAQGVNAPMFKVPLCIDTDLYHFSPRNRGDVFVFGAAGRTAVGGCRKRLVDVVEAFQKAFDGVDDVRLEVKCFPDDPEIACEDSRVVLKREFWTREQLAEWYRNIDCYVSASRGEGWSWHAHEAMATGRTVLAVNFGGISEFFDDSVGYEIPYALVPAGEYYEGSGLWADADMDAVVDLMRHVHRGSSEVQAKACLGASRAAEYGYEKHGSDIENVLKTFGYL